MTIRWYPGHMSKAHEQISELIRKVDVIVEVLDARLPFSSSNHLLEELRRNKPCIKVLNKNDLADPAVTKSWVNNFQKSSRGPRFAAFGKATPRGKTVDQALQALGPQQGQSGLACACHGGRYSQRWQVNSD